MKALRSARTLARLVLAWFALTLCAAIASPLVKHAGVEFICSVSASAKLASKGDAGKAPASHSLDCPLCVGTAAPPPAAQVATANLPVPGHAVQPIPAARIAALTAAPLPARGPPSFAPA